MANHSTTPTITSSPRLLSLSLAYPILGGCLFLIALKSFLKNKSQRREPLPPGPKGLPLIRNLLDLPSHDPWVSISSWSKKYGDVIYANAAGMDLVYLNTVNVAVDLLEKRSSLYSDRNHSSMTNLMGIGDMVFTLARYGDEWRLNRRIFHQEFNSSNALQFQEIQVKYNLLTLRLLLEDPAGFEKHFKFFASGILLQTMYGFDIKTGKDSYVRIAEKALEVVDGLIPGVWLVDAFPLLRYIPEWFPGAGFKRKARKWAENVAVSIDIPFEDTSATFERGTASPSFTTSWLERLESDNYSPVERARIRHTVKTAAGTAYTAGYETTSATMLNFVLLMLKHPGIQRKAQAELDKVIGRRRLPEIKDKEALHYVNAVCKEVLRWRPVVPFGLPHAVTRDDLYKGMRIPKGSTIIPNIWAMSRDPREYSPNPEEFRPERFLNSSVMDPTDYVFGFGRRICPGRYLAENNVFLAISSVLQTFCIQKAVNEDGSEKQFTPRWNSGLTTHLEAFPADFKLRFEGAEKMLNNDYAS